MKKLIYFLAALLALCGCTSESDSLVTAPQDEPIVLNSSIGDIASEVTRAPIESTHAAALNVAFVRIDQASDGTWPAWSTASKALLATRAATNGTAAITFNSGHEQYYPTGTENNAIRLVGWYPTSTSIVSGVVGFTIDGKTDFMVTDEVEGSASSKFTGSDKQFAFKHLLSRITVKAYGDAQASANWGTITSVKVKTYIGANYSLVSKSLQNVNSQMITLKNPANDTGMSAGVVLTNTTTGSAATCGYALISLPNLTCTLEVTTTKGGTRTVDVSPSSGSFLASTHYTVYLNFKSTTIAPYATVSPWTTSSDTPTGTFPN